MIGSERAGYSVYINTKDHLKLSQPTTAREIQQKMDEINNDKDLIPALVSKWHNKSYELANEIHDDTVAVTVAVWNKQKGELNFYSDGLDHSQEGIVIECSQNLENPNWLEEQGIKDNVKSVRFDETLQYCEPKSCNSWFKDFKNLEKIDGIEYLELKDCLDTGSMFENCESLKSVDLRVLNAGKVENIENMFRGCRSISEIDFNKFNTDVIAQQLSSVGLETLENCSKIGFLQDTVQQDILRVVPENIKPVFYGQDFNPRKFQEEVQKEAKDVAQKTHEARARQRGSKEPVGKDGYKVPGEDIGSR